MTDEWYDDDDEKMMAIIQQMLYTTVRMENSLSSSSTHRRPCTGLTYRNDAASSGRLRLNLTRGCFLTA
jgi:hypothetical protein